MIYKLSRHGIDRKFLTIIAITLLIFGIFNSTVTSQAVGDDQVYTGDSKDDPRDESSDYSDQ